MERTDNMKEQDKDVLNKEMTSGQEDGEEFRAGSEQDAVSETEPEAEVTDGPEGTEPAEDTAEADDAEGTEKVPEGETEKSWSKKRAEKKQTKQDKKEEAYKEQIAQLEDRVKRQLAEFENFRNRTEKEKQAMFETGAKSVIEKILPVVDNFERGFATVDPEDEEDAFVDGMRRVYKQLMGELENIGVKPIEAVGQEFDPNLHNAVMQVESDEYESGIVAQELQKGYTYRDSVVRHSMVGVTN